MKLFQNIGAALRTLKRRQPSKMFCPRCGGSKIHLSSVFDSWLMPRSYICDECGYTGPIIMELEKEEDND